MFDISNKQRYWVSQYQGSKDSREKEKKKKVEEIKKDKKFLYRISERLEGKYSNKKENYYNEEVNKRKAPRNKDSKEEKREEEKNSKNEKWIKKRGKRSKWVFKRIWKVGEQWRGSNAKGVPIIKSTKSV